MRRPLSVHDEHEFLLRMEQAGLNQELVQRIIDSPDNELALKAIKLIKRRGFEPSEKQNFKITCLICGMTSYNQNDIDNLAIL